MLKFYIYLTVLFFASFMFVAQIDAATKKDSKTIQSVKKEDPVAPAASSEPTVGSVTTSDLTEEEKLKLANEWIEGSTANEAVNDKVQLKTEKEIEVTEKDISVLKESEIPILNKSEAKAEAPKKSLSTRVIASLGIVLSIIFAFGFFARKYFVKAPQNKNKQIKVLTQHYLGPKKSLAIIRVAGESMLIGVTDQNINLIKTLALMDEEIPQETPKDFSTSLNSFFKKEKNKNTETESDDDEFSISKIKDVVSGKLKNMKEL